MTHVHPSLQRTGSGAACEVRRITSGDVIAALRAGLADFMAKPSHYGFVAVVYPVIGLALFTWASSGNALQLVYPLVTGFALLGPVAALGLYEISRRREHGLAAEWRHAFGVLRSPALPAITAVGLMLLVIFSLWLYAAQAVYGAVFGAATPDSLTGFVAEVFATARGWRLLLVGNAVGALFALLVLCTTVVAFPLMLDRGGGAGAAVATSLKAVQTNPVPMLLWGVVVAVCLFVGALPGLAGLIVVLPVLGHATWHLYRTVVADAPAARHPGAP